MRAIYTTAVQIRGIRMLIDSISCVDNFHSRYCTTLNGNDLLSFLYPHTQGIVVVIVAGAVLSTSSPLVHVLFRDNGIVAFARLCEIPIHSHT